MLGFSFGKLLVLAAVIAVVWYGFRYLSQRDAERSVARTKRREVDRRKAAEPEAEAGPEEMVRCPVCRVYVAARDPGSCGRSDCPY